MEGLQWGLSSAMWWWMHNLWLVTTALSSSLLIYGRVPWSIRIECLMHACYCCALVRHSHFDLQSNPIK